MQIAHNFYLLAIWAPGVLWSLASMHPHFLSTLYLITAWWVENEWYVTQLFLLACLGWPKSLLEGSNHAYYPWPSFISSNDSQLRDLGIYHVYNIFRSWIIINVLLSITDTVHGYEAVHFNAPLIFTLVKGQGQTGDANCGYIIESWQKYWTNWKS